jgi:hypothetical protein
MKISEIIELASYYGYDMREITGSVGYEERKGAVFALFDRRTGRIAASYSTKQQIIKFLEAFKID